MLSSLSIYKSPDPAGFHLRYFVAFCKIRKGKDGKLRQHKPQVQEDSHMTNDCSYKTMSSLLYPNVTCPGNQGLWATSWLLTWKASRPPKLKTNQGSSHQDFQMLSQSQKLRWPAGNSQWVSRTECLFFPLTKDPAGSTLGNSSCARHVEVLDFPLFSMEGSYPQMCVHSLLVIPFTFLLPVHMPF